MSAAVEATFAVGGYTAASFPQDAFVTKLAEAVQVSVNSISLAVSNARRDRARNLQTSGVTVVATIIAESDDLATSISSALAVDTDTLASSLGVTLTAPVNRNGEVNAPSSGSVHSVRSTGFNPYLYHASRRGRQRLPAAPHGGLGRPRDCRAE